MNDFKKSSYTTNMRRKSNKKSLLIALSSLMVIMIGFVLYGYLISPNRSAALPDIEISGIEVKEASSKDTKKDKQKILNVSIAKNSKDDGYCTLSLKNPAENISLVLDGAKKKQKGCSGWSINITTFPKGTYTAEVRFSGSHTTASDSSTFNVK